jgi:ferric-dicitrate binding protein FerR (iron transport regulator)
MTRHQPIPEAPHLSAAVPLSLLRMSAWQRLAGAAAVAALLWLAVWWATA